MRCSAFYQYRSGILHCEDVALPEVAREFGTPCYVYSAASIRRAFRSFREAFAEVDPLVCYAVKANSNLSLLKLLLGEGSGFDIVSGGELKRALHIGADPGRIVFSGVGKTAGELEEALEAGLFSIHVESLPELHLLAEIAGRRGKPARISFRFNPDVDAATHPYIATGLRRHKFGIDITRAGEVLQALAGRSQLRVIGVGCHIGSQIFDVEPFIAAFRRVRALADEFRAGGFPVTHLDLGGGLGVPYRPEDPAPDLPRYARVIAEERGDYGIVFEPGRLFVAESGALLTRVLFRKVNNEQHFVVVDGAMNDLLRPSLYQAYHEIAAVKESEPSVTADVVGPVCETGDFFARDRRLPELRRDDLAAILHAGAYGFCLSSNYNSRPRAPEVLVEGLSATLIRRRETFDDLIGPEL